MVFAHNFAVVEGVHDGGTDLQYFVVFAQRDLITMNIFDFSNIYVLYFLIQNPVRILMRNLVFVSSYLSIGCGST